MTDVQEARSNRFRWTICGLLFAATAINYLDRQMIGVLKPVISADLGWSETDYADVIFWFQAAYAIGYLLMGRFVDWAGARVGYAVAFSIWTAAHVMSGLSASAAQFAVARFVLGLGESGNFPAAVRTVSDWFPARERALAVGVFNAGSNVGAIATPLIVPLIVVAYGWRFAFILTGAISLVWLVAWLVLNRSPPPDPDGWADGPPAEDAPPRVGWAAVLRHRQAWAFIAAKFLTDPIWYLLLFWTPDFLAKRHGLDLLSFGPPLVAIYLLADVGSVFGGWGSSALVRRGVAVNRARRLTMLVAALAVTPIMLAQSIDGLWPAVAVIGLAAAAHQAWSANLLTMPSDLFPKGAVATVVGLGGAAGSVGGMIMAKLVGQVLELTGNYTLIFTTAAGAYLLALLVIHLLAPRQARV